MRGEQQTAVHCPAATTMLRPAAAPSGVPEPNHRPPAPSSAAACMCSLGVRPPSLVSAASAVSLLPMLCGSC